MKKSTFSDTEITVPENIRKVFAESEKYFPTPIQQFQFFDKYSRFNWDNLRRETWSETVDRSVAFLRELSNDRLHAEEYARIRDFMLKMKATPSMRLIAMAGEAARRQNIAIYNCSFLPIDSIDAWVEALIISMSGCGVGFSVEKQFIDKLPKVAYLPSEHIADHFVIPDTTDGWADAVRTGLNHWFFGQDVSFDYSHVRPEGSVLKIKGGRASGPKPLHDLLDFARKTILGAQGRQLTPLEAHSIMCMVGQAAVSGGVRRTAMISLFDFDDKEMRNCKDGDLTGKEYLWNSNNSAVWPETITKTDVVRQFEEMDAGQRGEPGIFSRDSARATMPERRDKTSLFGTNPCGEITLRPYEFCNLTIAIARPEDTLETLKEKVEVATIIGTIQSMAVSFPGLRPIWEENCKQERLLGTDINGWRDCPFLVEDNGTGLTELKNHAVETNKKYAEILGINQSASVTCVKPSGNSSQLFNCSSGIHPRHFPYYIRNVRVSTSSSLFKVLKDAGVPMDPENGQKAEDAITWVIHFPVKSLDGGKFLNELTAIDQCEFWLKAKNNWTEHNPSVTITYKSEELKDLTEWVWSHKDVIGGMSFLPQTDAKYEQMPYTSITKEEYEKLSSEFPKIDFSRIYLYEKEDMTTAAQELACLAGSCLIEDYSSKNNS